MSTYDDPTGALLAPGLTFGDALRQAVATLPCDELAYLVLTSKPEAVLRDRVALAVRSHLKKTGHPLYVSREFKDRVDLAVVNENGSPTTLVEFKSGHSTNARPIVSGLANDVVKCRELLALNYETSPVFLVLALIHYRSAGPESMDSFLKYQGETRRLRVPDGPSMMLATCQAKLNALFPELTPVPMDHLLGRDFGVDVELHWYVMGPISPTLPGDTATQEIQKANDARARLSQKQAR
ncbi:MAG: hypothetical protein EOO70_00905 [Myxococcaceae bacterium]|nr:MAG: hypothetical protein EOO70_00905 [Myxococcaceae bacterium]